MGNIASTATDTRRITRAVSTAAAVESRMDRLLDLVDIEPDAWREAEFTQAQLILDTLVGKRIASANVEDTRIVLTTEEGCQYFFYGFMGEDRSEASDEPEDEAPES